MPHRIEVGVKPGFRDARGESIRDQVREDLAIEVGEVGVLDVYTLDAELSPTELERVRSELFTDAVMERSAVDAPLAKGFDFAVEVGFLPGVTDNVGKSATEGLQDTLGRVLPDGERAYKSTLYTMSGGVSHETCDHIARDLLANQLIERWSILTASEFAATGGGGVLGVPAVQDVSDATVAEIDLEISDAELEAFSRKNTLALELDEMKAIQSHYRNADTQATREQLGLPGCATDIELEILAQTWSEHCKHKIFAANIEYKDEHGDTRTVEGLFKSYVKATTDVVNERVDWLVSVFHDNAGLVRFDDDWLFALKAETHNSPSALDPYGGALTGIVGCNRDILGAGLGCKCIFNTDVFCFAPPDYAGEIPDRLMHPRRVLRGVHRGVKDGGNQSGIPDVNGAFVFHDRFLGKPLVFCGTGGMIPTTVAGRPSHEKGARPGDRIVMCGGRIGKDGIHGATFSSEELHEGSPATAVQIGDPITQKKMADFLIEARDLGLFTSITDNGAGGLSSSIGEMAETPGGAEIHLDRAPLKYAGLAPWEIFLSEAQERMSLAVAPDQLDALMALAERREVEATDLGAFTDSGRLDCYYDGKLIGALDMAFLHDGVPTMNLKAVWTPPEKTPDIEVTGEDWTAALKRVLASYNVCSKESFVRMYDHEVQAQSVLKPFQGEENDGPGDAAVIRPVPGSDRGVAVACGIAPKYSDLDAYSMMACAIDEAVRNLVCVGGTIGTIAGLDNFCWPDPIQSAKTPDGEYKLAQLVRCCEALYETCVAYDIPLISGKDSMKNDYKIGDRKISIPPTVLFTAVSLLDDVRRSVSMDAKRPGDAVYVLGETKCELGGSEYALTHGHTGGTPPSVDTATNRKLYGELSAAIAKKLVASCHDCSDGGLAVALAETAFAGGFGMDVDLTNFDLTPDATLFSESQGRFVVTISPDQQAAFEQALSGSAYLRIGTVTESTRFQIAAPGDTTIDADIADLKQAWQAPLQW
jgi:phosphoribosylformylglycinamidine synthase